MHGTTARSEREQADLFPLGKPDCNYKALQREAAALKRAGLPMTVVIPAQLDPLQWPATDKEGNLKAGPLGEPLPAFCGKNPSCWQRDGRPRLLSPSIPLSVQEVSVHINTAERLGRPIGLAVIARDQLAIIDLDAKHYPDGADGVTAELTRLLTHHPDLAGTRIERTPSGGAHIFLALSEAEQTYLRAMGRSNGFNLSTTHGGPQRGELLHGNRIAVTAPTIRHDGAYSLLVADHAHNAVEVHSLVDLGIVPATKAAPSPAEPSQGRPRIELPDPPPPPSEQRQEAPRFSALLGKQAREVLNGGRPYGDDRSSNLAGLAREAYGWENWLRRHGLTAEGSADEVIAEGIDALGISDKADRVLRTIDREACNCCGGDESKASSRYGFHAKQTRRSATGTDASQQSEQKDGPQEGGAPPPPIPLAQLKESLSEALAEGVSGSDLAILCAALAEEHSVSVMAVQRVADAIQREHSQAAEIATEAAQIAAAADRTVAAQTITEEFLLPPQLAHAVRVRTRYLPCEGPSAVLPLLAAVASMVRLGTRVEASRAADYSVPINVFGGLVGKSGGMKTPVNGRLVEAPTHAVRLELSQQNDRAYKDWEEKNRGVNKGERTPMPDMRRLMVSEATGEAIAAQLQIQESAGLGMLIYRDELAGLFGGLNAYRAGRGSDEQQLLELFDGGGMTVLRIGESRHYNRSQVSIWGSTQPEVLSELVSKGDANGLWARFLWVPLPEREVQLPLTTDAAEIAEVDAAAEALAEACRKVHSLPPRTYRLAAEAAERFGRYHLQKQRDALAATVGAHGSLHGKSAGKCLRVAGVLHLLQVVTGTAANEGAIDAETIDRAATLVDHLDSWALSLHAGIANGGATDIMRTVHRIASKAGRPVKWRDVQNGLSKAKRKEIDAGMVASAMEALAAAGYGSLLSEPTGKVAYRAEKPLP